MSGLGLPSGAEPSLAINPPAPPANPLGMISGFASVQNQLNQNKLFQQTYSARQQAGQIIASSPDLDTAFQRMQSDPQVAPFAGEVMNGYRQLELTNAQLQGEYQTQSQHGIDAALKFMPMLVENPTMDGWNKLTSSALGALSPVARSRVAPVLNNLGEYLTDGLPSDPAAASAMVKQRTNGILIAGGFTPDVISGLSGFGKPTTAETPTGTYFGSQAPGFEGGAFAPNTFVAKPLAPQTTSIAGVPTIVGGGQGAVNQLTPGAAAFGQNVAPVSPRNALGVSQPTAAPAASAPGGNATPGATQLAGDGKPLIPPGTPFSSPAVGKGIAGVNILSPAQQAAAGDMQKEWQTTGLRAFDNAQSTQALLAEMDRDYDTMSKGGGFLVPGTAADLRVQIGKLGQTFAQVTGQPVDQNALGKIASAEEFVKDTRKMGLTVLTSMLGNQREAAQTINNITQAVPGIENTYLGGKLLIGSIKATTQRAIDQRNFENAWQAQNQGNLTGADEAFNAAHPAADYANSVLNKFGMTSTGFASPQAVQSAVQNGYLTRQQAIDISKSQWPNGYKGQ